ncbi:BQ5605_C005g03546 [Microbotryum silenes-dioicae]|uniref:BQ5605_C005g03546 protein n=1 Tax=Microbotryum silenes-dioicae TaxID=796604 RepID=A0A2X0N4Z5_9BASI|nr:BQ5605_C005g03546 [Microbotryum silenes-dioicae]
MASFTASLRSTYRVKLLPTVARTPLQCTCGAVYRRSFATSSSPAASTSTSQAPAQDKLITATRTVLDQAKATNDGGIAAAKRERELDGLRRALADVEDGQALISTLQELADAEPDEELRELALGDLPEATATLASLRSTLLNTLLPPTPTASLSAILEVKSGVGGSESSLFAAELVRMYTRLAVRKGWKASLVEVVGLGSVGQGTGDAYREAILEVTGEGAFGMLRREAGVHRVQRVPATESQGRLHTSTVGIIVLPSETGNSAPIDDDLFDQKDVKVEVMRSRGAGGQHVNKTESAIRLTHQPTGISVSMQDSRSQHENRTKAYKVLRARLMDRKLQIEQEARRSVRRNQVRGADRSEKIRTYNFPQDRLTDHRIPLTISGLADAMEGGETLDMVARELQIREEEDGIEDILAGVD